MLRFEAGVRCLYLVFSGYELHHFCSSGLDPLITILLNSFKSLIVAVELIPFLCDLQQFFVCLVELAVEELLLCLLVCDLAPQILYRFLLLLNIHVRFDSFSFECFVHFVLSVQSVLQLLGFVLVLPLLARQMIDLVLLRLQLLIRKVQVVSELFNQLSILLKLHFALQV